MSPQKKLIPILIFTLLISSSTIVGVFWGLAYFYNIDSSYIFHFSTNNREQKSQNPDSSESGGFARVSDVPSGLFPYGGSTTWVPIRAKTEPAIEKVFQEYDLRYTDPAAGFPDSTIGINMLLNNELAFSQTSRSLTEKEYEAARLRGLKLTEIPVAIDGIAVAVHPEINISGLTIENLKNIYAGKILNWKELGGPNSKITPYSKQNKGGTVEFFVKNVLHKEKFGKNVKKVGTTTEGLEKVTQNRGGIFYGSAPELVTQCGIKTLPIARVGEKFVPPYKEPLISHYQCPKKRNQVNKAAFRSGEYPMTRRLFVVVKQNDKIEEKAGRAYARLMLTQEGQKLISEAGFVRIR